MSRKKKVDEQPQATPEQPRADFPAWLDTLEVTRPFTIADCSTLKDMLKKDMPTFLIDVVFDETHVHIFAYASRECMTATYKRDLVLT